MHAINEEGQYSPTITINYQLQTILIIRHVFWPILMSEGRSTCLVDLIIQVSTELFKGKLGVGGEETSPIPSIIQLDANALTDSAPILWSTHAGRHWINDT